MFGLKLILSLYKKKMILSHVKCNFSENAGVWLQRGNKMQLLCYILNP